MPLDGEGATAVGSSEILRSSGCISAAENIKRCMKIMVKNWELTFFSIRVFTKTKPRLLTESHERHTFRSS